MLRPPTGPTGPTAPSSPLGGQSGRGPQGKRFGAPLGGGLRLELEEGEQIAEGIADGDGAAPGLALAFAARAHEAVSPVDPPAQEAQMDLLRLGTVEDTQHRDNQLPRRILCVKALILIYFIASQ